jgi:hypothetical protein
MLERTRAHLPKSGLQHGTRTIYEDKDILNTIHYLPGALTKGDTTLSRYLHFLRHYPRAHPSRPFSR